MSNKQVSNLDIDSIYSYAIKCGAWGGKVCGAGGGGVMLFSVDPHIHPTFIKKMQNQMLERVDFGVDYNGLQVREL